MDVSASLEAPVPADRLFRLVEELTRYPAWMPLAHRVRRLDELADTEPEGTLAWDVEIRARLGPLARSKRLRMVRRAHDTVGRRVRFERRETDGRTHAPWILDAQVLETPGGSRLDMQLHYGGALWAGGLMERVLADQIVAGREQLLTLLAETEPQTEPGRDEGTGMDT
jgi:hypothetical protein